MQCDLPLLSWYNLYFFFYLVQLFSLFHSYKTKTNYLHTKTVYDLKKNSHDYFFCYIDLDCILLQFYIIILWGVCWWHYILNFFLCGIIFRNFAILSSVNKIPKFLDKILTVDQDSWPKKNRNKQKIIIRKKLMIQFILIFVGFFGLKFTFSSSNFINWMNFFWQINKTRVFDKVLDMRKKTRFEIDH